MTENDKKLSKIFKQDISEGLGIICMSTWLPLKTTTINKL